MPARRCDECTGTEQRRFDPIDTKTTVGGSVPDYSAMMAQNQQLIAALANLQSNPIVNAIGAEKVQTIVNHWRQWVYYCYKCGVNLKHNSNKCKWKDNGHKDDATFADKKGGLAKRDHLWQLWCDPITNRVHKASTQGAKTTA